MKRERRTMRIAEEVCPVQAMPVCQRVSSPPEIPQEYQGVASVVAGHIDASEWNYARQGERGSQAGGREHADEESTKSHKA